MSVRLDGLGIKQSGSGFIGLMSCGVVSGGGGTGAGVCGPSPSHDPRGGRRTMISSRHANAKGMPKVRIPLRMTWVDDSTLPPVRRRRRSNIWQAAARAIPRPTVFGW